MLQNNAKLIVPAAGSSFLCRDDVTKPLRMELSLINFQRLAGLDLLRDRIKKSHHRRFRICFQISEVGTNF